MIRVDHTTFEAFQRRLHVNVNTLNLCKWTKWKIYLAFIALRIIAVIHRSSQETASEKCPHVHNSTLVFRKFTSENAKVRFKEGNDCDC